MGDVVFGCVQNICDMVHMGLCGVCGVLYLYLVWVCTVCVYVWCVCTVHGVCRCLGWYGTRDMGIYVLCGDVRVIGIICMCLCVMWCVCVRAHTHTCRIRLKYNYNLLPPSSHAVRLENHQGVTP